MATLYRKRYNLLTNTLGAALTDGTGTSITFGSALKEGGSGGSNIATLSSDEYLPLTIDNEIVYLTAYTSGATSGTIVRAQEQTVGVSHSNGATVKHAGTKLDAIAVPEQSVPMYPFLAVTDTDLCRDTAGWTDVGTNAWTSFTSDGKSISAYIVGASKTSRSRYTLTNTKTAAYDISLCVLPEFMHWSTTEDSKLNIYLKTSADAQIAKAQIGFTGSTAPQETYHVQFGSTGSVTDGFVYVSRGSPIVLRFTRDGSNVLGFQYGLGTPFRLANYLNSADDTVFAPTSSGTVARIEAEITTPSGPGTTARFGFFMDWLQSL